MKHKFIFLTTGITVFCLFDFTAFSSNDDLEMVSRTPLVKNKLKELQEGIIKSCGKEYGDFIINFHKNEHKGLPKKETEENLTRLFSRFLKEMGGGEKSIDTGK
jgi:hypothetical protein